MGNAELEKTKNITAAVFSITIFLLIWQCSVSFSSLGRLMPGPAAILSAFFRSFTVPIGKYNIMQHTLFSLSRVLIAYSVACVVGISLGLLMGRVRLIEAIFRPFYEIIRPIPPIAWISLAILWFGLGEMTKYFLIFLSAFANVTYTAMAGASSVDPTLVGAARMLGAKNSRLFTTVVLPSTAPYIFSGMQVALGTSWATVVAAEMVRSSEGVGWIIVSGMEINNITQILVGILSIGIMGYLLATLLRFLEKIILSWNVGGV
ncbi:taurine ABC transporter permease [Spirochaetia bacterium]|nr:taurine ABC transporter permease [Spirochaetia bacterium]